MRSSLAVIGVGNMAKAIVSGIMASDSSNTLSSIHLFDVNKEQYTSLLSLNTVVSHDNLEDTVSASDTVLISVKPQNYPEVLDAIKSISGYENKLYISIGAGISTDSIRASLGNVSVVRALPNLPMVIGKGVTAICNSSIVTAEDMELVRDIFSSSGSVLMIDESEMNRVIGVTSSSPAYVFKFIAAICEGAKAQGIESDDMLNTVCDMVIGAAALLKNSDLSAAELISRVASKGGTTERALLTLDSNNFDNIIIDAMKACTTRADELGAAK